MCLSTEKYQYTLCLCFNSVNSSAVRWFSSSAVQQSTGSLESEGDTRPVVNKMQLKGEITWEMTPPIHHNRRDFWHSVHIEA